jgi:6-phosphogluconolactonase
MPNPAKNKGEILIFPNPEELSRAAAKMFVELAVEAIETSNLFTVALAGGSTPRRMYELLADNEQEFRNHIDWEKTHFFFGDERHVPPDSPESNFRMANEALFSKIDLPTANVHRFLTENSDAAQVAELYENELKSFFSTNLPVFDLILLGLGSDAHTASLFPESPIVEEQNRLVAAPFVEKLGDFRLTLTPLLINNSSNIIFLVAGTDKAEALRNVLQGEPDPLKFPAQIVSPTNGKLIWLADNAAAKLLSKND